MKDIFGNEITERTASLSVFCDERKIESCYHQLNENWLYISLLIIPTFKKTEILEKLGKYREDENYPYELSFRNIDAPSRNSNLTRLAKLWIKEVVEDLNKCFYFSILGINKDRLLFELFGEKGDRGGREENIYNRFFRANFKGAINLLFPENEYEKIVISELFHDKQGRLEAHSYFPWHLISKVSDDRISFGSNTFRFIDSDNMLEPVYKDESHFIQLADILVGSFSHCLDLPAPYSEGKKEVAKIALPLLENIVNGVYIKDRWYSISFFPSRKLSWEEYLDPTYRSQSRFFTSRRILLKESLSGQLSFLDKVKE